MEKNYTNKPLPFTSDEIRKVFETNLIQYAVNQGFEVEKSDRKSFSVKGFGGLFLFPHGFHHFSANESGNILDFCKTYQGLEFKEAVENILNVKAYENTKPSFDIKEKPKGKLELPQKSKNNDLVKKYLTKDRCLDPIIVDELIAQGKIYQATTQYKGTVFMNCAFVAFNEDKEPKYCALRGFSGSFRQDLLNSNKTYGFEMKGNSSRVFVFEAPIDAISHATLCKLNNYDYTKDSRISSGGLSDKALTRFLEKNPQVKSIIFCFDNDMEAKDMKGQPQNHGQIFAQKCAEKFTELGYKTKIQTPKSKDFNLDLQNHKKSVINQLKHKSQNQTQPAKSNNIERKEIRR